MPDLDVLILGGGIAGVSLAARLAPEARVALIEVEDQLGRHATGRSAALFFESYGDEAVRALTRASRAFLVSPPAGFAEAPLMRPRGALFVCDSPRAHRIDEECGRLEGALRPVSAAEARARVPILRRDWCAGGAYDGSGYDIDVAAVLQGFLRQAKRAGAQIILDARRTEIDRREGVWRVATAAGAFSAPTLVNATGAWGDETARAAGVTPIGLVPMRRTAFLIPAPDGFDVTDWPLVIDIDETFYFKPDAGRLLLSPANEDPEAPADAAPDDLDVAIAVDRFEHATTHRVQRISHRWAGLRTFAPDRTPVVGFDPVADGFFWLVGQGGAGIQTAPAASEAAAALILGRDIPGPIRREGMTSEALSPGRPALGRSLG